MVKRDAEQDGGRQRGEGEGETGPKPSLEHPAGALEQQERDEQRSHRQEQAEDDLGDQQYAQGWRARRSMRTT